LHLYFICVFVSFPLSLGCFWCRNKYPSLATRAPSALILFVSPYIILWDPATRFCMILTQHVLFLFWSDYPTLLKLKTPTWTQEQLKEAIEAVVKQKMRFTQASARYGIPKGTLYDNILGKSKRMAVLEEAGLTPSEEAAVLEFCCDVSVSPYNRRTKKSLQSVLNFVEKLRRNRDPEFMFTGLSGFRWWWAFCKKHNIVSLYYENNGSMNNTLN
jgi:hypothetical protein